MLEMSTMKRWLRYPLNLLFHGKWTACEHKRRKLVKHYFSECVDCGALFDDYLHTVDDEQPPVNR
jgi:hypothetical protein